MVDTEELIEKLYRHANDYAEGNTQDFADVFRDCKLAADTISTLKFSKKIMFDDIKKCLDDYEDSYNKKKSVNEDMEKLNPYALLVKMQNGVAIEENSMAVSWKLKIELSSYNLAIHF